MLQWLNKIFGKNKNNDLLARLEVLEQTSKDLHTQTEQLVAEKQALEQELVVHKETAGQRQDKQDSNEPWVEIVSESFDERKGIQLGLDWNDAFISYLKENGITGVEEDEIVRKYLAYLYHDMAERMEQHEIDVSDQRGKISDFQ